MAKRAKKAKGKKKSNGQIERGGIIKRELACPIDDKIADRKKDRILVCLNERVRLKEEIRPTQVTIKSLGDEVERLRKDIASRSEMREVKCREEFDYAHRVVRVRRLDTDQLVPDLERTMEAEDRMDDLLTGETPAERSAKMPAAPTQEPATVAELLAEKTAEA